MPTLEIITIGTELLLGEITDTNSTYLARTLRDHGIDIYRITTIGDNPGRITASIKEALKRAEIVITTGGLGPTIDDPTRQAVADAVDHDLVYHPELWVQIVEKFKDYGRVPTENNKRQAYLPEGAIPINNPVGTAPCYIVELGESCVISLPGVPREMETILQIAVIPYLKKRYELISQIIKAAVLHVASLGESIVDEMIADLEQQTNPTVGLLAHPGQVDIRVTAKASSEIEALKLIKPVIEELKVRLGNNIYGQDEETLEGVLSQKLNQNNIKLGLAEFGLDGSLISRIKLAQPDHLHAEIIESTLTEDADLSPILTTLVKENHCDIGLGVFLYMNQKVTAHFVYQDAHNSDSIKRSYGGPREYAELWAQNAGLDFLRRNLDQYR